MTAPVPADDATRAVREAGYETAPAAPESWGQRVEAAARAMYDRAMVRARRFVGAGETLDRSRWNEAPDVTREWYLDVAAAALTADAQHTADGEEERCKTCNGRVWSVQRAEWVATRETVGMVCQTCGTDYGTSPAVGSGGGRTQTDEADDYVLGPEIEDPQGRAG